MSKTPSHIKSTWFAWRSKRLPVSFKLDKRVPLAAFVILAFTAIVIVISISYGEYDISPLEVVQTLTHTLSPEHSDYRNFNLVVFTFRLPRIWVAFLVGAALATSGAIMQSITRNPLAEPGILGVSSGAGLAAVFCIVWLRDVPANVLPIAAFTGAFVTFAAIYILAWKGSSTSPIRLILIGVAIASMLDSLITLMLVFGNINDVQQAYVWLTGSVYGRNWEHVNTMALWLIVLLPLAFISARQLNALNLGEDLAKSLGQRVELQRAFLLIISVALAAVSVSVSGTIGFVGLVAPHITRRLVGPSHEGLLPVTALFGGALLVIADLIGRWVISPSELPIGIVTALIGAPYFMFLLYRSRS